MARVSEWLALARTVGAIRFLVDGSFVTAKPEPGDVDCVCWLSVVFERQLFQAKPEAVRLYQMLVTRQPEELFGAFSLARWEGATINLGVAKSVVRFGVAQVDEFSYADAPNNGTAG